MYHIYLDEDFEDVLEQIKEELGIDDPSDTGDDSRDE